MSREQKQSPELAMNEQIKNKVCIIFGHLPNWCEAPSIFILIVQICWFAIFTDYLNSSSKQINDVLSFITCANTWPMLQNLGTRGKPLQGHCPAFRFFLLLFFFFASIPILNMKRPRLWKTPWLVQDHTVTNLRSTNESSVFLTSSLGIKSSP